MAFLREQGDKHRDMSWWCLGSRAHSISQLQNKPKKKDAVIIKSIQHGFTRFGSWVDCLRERALKYVKNLTTSPMVSLPFFIPNCTFSLLPQLPKCNAPLWLIVTLSWTQMHLHTRPTDSNQLQSWEENRFTIAELELSLPNRNEGDANFWTLGKFKSVFSQLTALWLNTHLNVSLQFGETGNNIFIISILQMVELKHCKVYWLTQSCTACLNGSRTPAGLIPTPGLLAVTLSCICSF